MRNSKITIKPLIEMCNSVHAQKIKEIDLSKNFSTVNSECLKLFAQSKHLVNLESLNLSDTDVDDEGINAFVNSPNSAHMKSLVLYGQYKITNSFLFSLAKRQLHITYLDLRGTCVNDEGMRIYSESNCAQYIQYLDLSMNFEQITDKTLHYISKNNMSFLQVLKLANCKITKLGMEWFC